MKATPVILERTSIIFRVMGGDLGTTCMGSRQTPAEKRNRCPSYADRCDLCGQRKLGDAGEMNLSLEERRAEFRRLAKGDIGERVKIYEIATSADDDLMQAVLNGNLADVRKSLAAGACADMNDIEHSYTMLNFAIWGGHAEIVRLLLENQADVNAQDEDGNTIFADAVNYGNLEIVELLLNHGANIFVEDSSGNLPLATSVSRKHSHLVPTLIASGADVNASDYTGKTPLMIAAEYGLSEMANLLLTYGADVTLTDSEGRTAADWASEEGHKALSKCLKLTTMEQKQDAD